MAYIRGEKIIFFKATPAARDPVLGNKREAKCKARFAVIRIFAKLRYYNLTFFGRERASRLRAALDLPSINDGKRVRAGEEEREPSETDYAGVPFRRLTDTTSP